MFWFSMEMRCRWNISDIYRMFSTSISVFFGATLPFMASLIETNFHAMWQKCASIWDETMVRLNHHEMGWWHHLRLIFYFVLRTQAEMAHTCRGTIPLATAHIEVGETCHFVLTSGGRSYHLKATSEGECQRWVSALQQAKASATLLMPHSGRKEFRRFDVVEPFRGWFLGIWWTFTRNDAGHLEMHEVGVHITSIKRLKAHKIWI